MKWISIYDEQPEENVTVAGIEMPYEAISACHLELGEQGEVTFFSDETGEMVIVDYWCALPDPPHDSREEV